MKLKGAAFALLVFVALAPSQSATRGVGASTQSESWQLLTLPAPTFGRVAPRATKPPARGPRLVVVSERRNNITDDGAWFARHGLSLPVYEVPSPAGVAGDYPVPPLPDFVPVTFRGQRLVEAIRQPGTVFAIYGRNFSEGRYLVALYAETGRFRYGFDFVNYAYPPNIAPGEREFVYQHLTWAAEEGGTLYVSHRHMTYARSSKGMNAYLTALDTRAGRVLWRSAPLVSNAANFEVVGDQLVTGYGFTAEPDFLYLLDRRTGAVKQRLPVRSGPRYILRRGDRLHVRAYDTDYVLRLAGAPAR